MRPQRAVEARELITDLGVTFIKIAQVWASRPDILPKEYLKAAAFWLIATIATDTVGIGPLALMPQNSSDYQGFQNILHSNRRFLQERLRETTPLRGIREAAGTGAALRKRLGTRNLASW